MSALVPAPPPDASSTQRGLVNLLAQSFEGVKTFLKRVVLSVDLQFADATVQSTAGISPAAVAATYQTIALAETAAHAAATYQTIAGMSSYLTTASAASTYLPLTGGTVTGNVTSSVASGSNALTLGTGARLKLGGGTNDYLRSDGTSAYTPGRFGVGTAPNYPLHVAGLASGGAMFGVTGSQMVDGDIAFYLGGPTLTGSCFAAYCTAALTGEFKYYLANTNTTNGAAHATFSLAAGGASGGDAKATFTINGVLDWAAGVDNSDSDKFKICASSSLGNVGGLSLTAAGKLGLPNSGAAASNGTATLVGGTVTVATTAVAAGDRIFLTRNTPGGTVGDLSAPNASIVAGTSFVINSGSGTDTSTVNWWILSNG